MDGGASPGHISDKPQHVSHTHACSPNATIQMGDRDPQERVESALLQLVEVYIRGIDDEDQSDTEERQDEYVRRAQATIQRSAFYQSPPSLSAVGFDKLTKDCHSYPKADLVEDAQHLGDLIKRQRKAVDFSKLCGA